MQSVIRAFVVLGASFAAALAFGQIADIVNPAEVLSTTLYGEAPRQANPASIAATLLDTRSGLITGVGTGSGGADVSALQNSSLAMGAFGFSASITAGIRMADNFTVPANGWAIEKITTYAYQTGSTTTSTFTALNFRIWNGPPDVVGSAVVFGDTTTNRMTATSFTNIYRVTETTLTSTARPIMAIEAGGLNLILPAGNYWLDWQAGGTLASGPFAPPLTTLGQTVTGDAIQFNSAWVNAVDVGQQGFPMTITGVPAGVTVTQSGGTTDVTEGGATDTFTVTLNSPPTANVTVTLTPDAQLSVAPGGLTFTPANWNVAQTVTVTAVDDFVAEGAHSGTISFALTSTDANYNALAVANVTANITDNDVAGVTVVQSGGSTNVTEGGATDSFTVVLTSQPTGNVTVTVTPNAQVTTSTGSLVFTAANWNVAQTVTVTAVDDAIAEGAHTGSIALTVASSDTNYNALAIASVTANITDNDVAGVTVVQSGGSTDVTEGGATDSFTVVLTSQPTGNVTVTVTPNAQVTTSTGSLVFTPANWNVPQSVTVTAVDDAIAEGAHTGSIALTVASSDTNYNALAIASVTANITDNDFAGVTVVQSGGSTNVTEGGATDSFTVVLTSQPTGNVTFTVTPNAQVTTSTGSLVFTAANWNVAQTVTVTAVDDAIAEGAHTGSIALTVASSDTNYNALAIASVTANITDNDVAAVTVVQSGGSTNVTEGGATDSFTVVLTSQPTGNVTFTVTPNAQVTTSTGSLAFTPANWNVPQSVTVTAVDDPVFEAAHFGTVSFTVASADANYNGLSVASISVSITDNDMPPVVPVPTLSWQALLALLLLLTGTALGTLRRPTRNV